MSDASEIIKYRLKYPVEIPRGNGWTAWTNVMEINPDSINERVDSLPERPGELCDLLARVLNLPLSVIEELDSDDLAGIGKIFLSL